MAEPQAFVAIFEEAVPSNIVTRAKDLLSAENVYRLSDAVLLLRGPFANPDSLMNVLQLSEEANTGVVFRLNGSYSGYHYERLWDWLKAGR